jgi:hypothetical protein
VNLPGSPAECNGQWRLQCQESGNHISCFLPLHVGIKNREPCSQKIGNSVPVTDFGRRHCDDLAGSPEAAVGSRNVKRSSEGGCRGIIPLRLYGMDCSHGLGGQRSLAQALGRPRGCPGAHSSDSPRRVGGHAFVSARMRLLLKSSKGSARAIGGRSPKEVALKQRIKAVFSGAASTWRT